MYTIVYTLHVFPQWGKVKRYKPSSIRLVIFRVYRHQENKTNFPPKPSQCNLKRNPKWRCWTWLVWILWLHQILFFGPIPDLKLFAEGSNCHVHHLVSLLAIMAMSWLRNGELAHVRQRCIAPELVSIHNMYAVYVPTFTHVIIIRCKLNIHTFSYMVIKVRKLNNIEQCQNCRPLLHQCPSRFSLCLARDLRDFSAADPAGELKGCQRPPRC